MTTSLTGNKFFLKITVIIEMFRSVTSKQCSSFKATYIFLDASSWENKLTSQHQTK